MEKVSEGGTHVPGMQLCCWKWTGALDAKGRPRFRLGERSILAKRALIEMFAGGQLADGWNVGSLCGNPSCVRPDHLVVCNDIDHAALRADGHLSADTTLLVRELFSDGYALEEIAVVFSVSTRLIRAILRESGELSGM